MMTRSAGGRGCRRVEERPAGIAEIAGEEDALPFVALAELEEDRGRPENVTGVDEGRADARRDVERNAVADRPTEAIERREGIDHGVERRRHVALLAAPHRPALALAGVFFLDVGGIEHDQARQLARRRGRDDLAAKAALRQEREAPDMIEMSVGEEDEVYSPRIEAERPGILLVELAASLELAAIDQHALAGTFDEVARAGDVAVGTMEGELHDSTSVEDGAGGVARAER